MNNGTFPEILPKDTKQSAVAVEIRSALANTKSPVQYIVHLGCLQCIATHTHGTRSTGSSKPWNTPFAIVLNIVEKSLWMVLGKFRMDTNEPDEPIEETDNNWDFLPESANGRPSFDVMCDDVTLWGIDYEVRIANGLLWQMGPHHNPLANGLTSQHLRRICIRRSCSSSSSLLSFSLS